MAVPEDSAHDQGCPCSPQSPTTPLQGEFGNSPTITAFFTLLEAHSLEAIPSSRALPAPSLGKPDTALGRKRPSSAPLAQCSTGPGHTEIPTQEYQKLTFLKAAKPAPVPQQQIFNPDTMAALAAHIRQSLHGTVSPEPCSLCARMLHSSHRTKTAAFSSGGFLPSPTATGWRPRPAGTAPCNTGSPQHSPCLESGLTVPQPLSCPSASTLCSLSTVSLLVHL